MAQFADHLKDAVDLDWVRADLARVVQQALEPAHTSVWFTHRPVRVALHDHQGWRGKWRSQWRSRMSVPLLRSSRRKR